MNRKYDTATFFEKTELLRRYFPGCGLTADLIVGFPGETEEDHRATLDFIEKCGFSAMHIFPYSPRPGTKAAAMPEQLERSVKARRAAEAQAVAERMQADFLQAQVGTVLPVIFETVEENAALGHSDNYCEVRSDGDAPRGIVKYVEITGRDGQTLTGKII